MYGGSAPGWGGSGSRERPLPDYLTGSWEWPPRQYSGKELIYQPRPQHLTLPGPATTAPLNLGRLEMPLLLLLLLSHFTRVRLCATPQMAAHQAPPSLGFSRQEY